MRVGRCGSFRRTVKGRYLLVVGLCKVYDGPIFHVPILKSIVESQTQITGLQIKVVGQQLSQLVTETFVQYYAQWKNPSILTDFWTI